MLIKIMVKLFKALCQIIFFLLSILLINDKLILFAFFIII